MKKRGFDEFLVALFMPVTTVLLSLICLSATTWAWFTATLSTGVNSITAGPQVDVTVKDGEQIVPETDGKYALTGNKTYTVELKAGKAETGYVVLMEIDDESTSATSSPLDLFFTPIYAETVNTKYYVDLSKDSKTTLAILTPSESSQKQMLSIKKLWCEKEGESIKNSLIDGYKEAGETIDLNPVITSYTINLLDENGNPLKQSEVMSSSLTYSEKTSSDEAAVITEQDTELTEITIPVIEGYELVSVNGAEAKESYQLTEGQDNVFNVVYKKIEEIHDTPAQEESVETNSIFVEEDKDVVEDPPVIVEGKDETNPSQEPCQTQETTPTTEQIEEQSCVELEEQNEMDGSEEEQSEAKEQIEEEPIEQN